MSYAVKELFHTLQGEGAQAGRAAVFCRFAGCNLWSGREEDRAEAACRFCDTDFVGLDGEGGGRFSSAQDLAVAISETWRGGENNRYVVFTGGEPLLQLDPALIDAVHGRGFEIAVETNGTLPAPEGIDWICVSPKAGNPLVQASGHELKLVFPQGGFDLDALASLPFRHHWLQPMDGSDRLAATQAAVEHCRGDARWRLSLQTHKIIGIP
ncbi:7-carboxy-7-deazaguanine synthase [uncultured Methylobacterium sp.]|uniref:7-carboxy-7-deazaguanine synthase n=1 Tax=uncultured Methylobacterium sp. TaxID=157278 RepID=UPI0035CC1E5B